MISYELDADRIAVITIHNSDGPLNILTNNAIRELADIYDELLNMNPAPLGMIIISGKDDNFVVGADIKEFLNFRDAAHAADVVSQGQAVFGQVRKMRFPTVAAINGTCLGGGFEMSLNYDSRIITDHPKTAFGFPEVKLGLLPGASGSQLLPRLVTLPNALDIMLTGKNIYPYKAKKIGLAEEIVSPGVLLDAARKQVHKLVASGGKVRRPKRAIMDKLQNSVLKPVVYNMATKNVLKQTKGLYPAPFKIIEVVKKGLRQSLEKGLQVEARGFGELSITPEHKALTHVFFSSTKGKPSVDANVPIDQVGILGAGLMGTGIGTVCLDKELTVRHKDISFEALGNARAHIEKYFAGKVKKRIITKRDAGLLLTHYSPTIELAGLGKSQIVVEAVFEDLSLKRKLIAELEEVLPPETVIATNTSSLPIEAIAEGARHPERIIGMHFFSPVEKMPLVEIIPSKYTNAHTLATTVSLGKAMGKTMMVVKDVPGFYVNRILTPYLNEAFKLLEDGIAIDMLDKFAEKIGFPVGPFKLLDEVGLDVANKVSGVMSAFIGDRLEMTDHNSRMMEGERLGRKNGKGLYMYEGGRRLGPDPSIYQLLDNPKRKTIYISEVRRRLLGAILNEAAYAMGEGLIESVDAGDIGAIFGFGFPPFLGGPYWVMDQIGLDAFVEDLDNLKSKFGPRFEAAPDLRIRAKANNRYYSN